MKELTLDKLLKCRELLKKHQRPLDKNGNISLTVDEATALHCFLSGKKPPWEDEVV